MKCISTIEIHPTEIYKQLSYEEISRVEVIIHKRIKELILENNQFTVIGNKITRSFWLQMPPHYFSFDLDIHILVGGFVEEFSGPIIFYNTRTEFLLAQELHFLKYDNNYVRYNVRQ